MGEHHSLLGGSALKRYRICSGSVTLTRRMLGLGPETRALILDDDPDYTTRGSLAHHIAAKCLEEGSDAWEHMGETLKDISPDVTMTNNVQSYVDHCRSLMYGAGKAYIEFHFADPEVHPEYEGTLDWAWVTDTSIDICDYKNGFKEVDVEENDQFLYYAYKIVLMHPEVRRVRLWCVQPNVYDVPQKWETTAEWICEWANDVMIPAMERTAVDLTLKAGDHCQFCPAKLGCPMLHGIIEGVNRVDPRTVITLSDERLGQLWLMREPVKHLMAAVQLEVMKRALQGRKCEGTKLVRKKANRTWKSNAESELFSVFKNEIYTAPVMKSPAQIEELGPEGKRLVKSLAYTPESGYTIASEDAKAPEVKPPPRISEIFADVIAGEDI